MQGLIFRQDIEIGPLKSINSEELIRSLLGQGDAIQVEQSGDDIMYLGRLADLATQEEFDVAVTVHEALFGRGSEAYKMGCTNALVIGFAATTVCLRCGHRVRCP